MCKTISGDINIISLNSIDEMVNEITFLESVLIEKSSEVRRTTLATSAFDKLKEKYRIPKIFKNQSSFVYNRINRPIIIIIIIVKSC